MSEDLICPFRGRDLTKHTKTPAGKETSFCSAAGQKNVVINGWRGKHEGSDTLGDQRRDGKMKWCNEELNMCNGSEHTKWKITNHWHHNSSAERLFCLHFGESRQFRR